MIGAYFGLAVSRIGEAANPGPLCDSGFGNASSPGEEESVFRFVTVNVTALKPHTVVIVRQIAQQEDPTRAFFVQEHAVMKQAEKPLIATMASGGAGLSFLPVAPLLPRLQLVLRALPISVACLDKRVSLTKRVNSFTS